MNKISRPITYIFLIIVSILSIFPFVWMIIGATNSATDVMQGKLTLGSELTNNFKTLVGMVNLPLVLWNSAKIAIISTLLLLLVCSLAGYGFEIYRSKFKDKVYSVVLLTMMIPFAALMIPLFKLFAKMGLLDSHWAVVLPTISTAFMIFFFRQNTKSFPREIMQAARVDGLNEFQIFLYMYIPTMKSTYAAGGIIAFMTSWNNFLWPLIILQSDGKKTITLVISSLSSAYFPEYGVIMVAIVIATLPTILIFFLLQKNFVEGMLGSIK